MTPGLGLRVTDEAPVAAEGSVTSLTGAAGIPVRAALFTPTGRAAGSVILSPGRAEPIEKYFEVIGELLARRLVVLVHDWRGQGLSRRLLKDAQRGHGDDWRCYVADYRDLVGAYVDRLPQPRIALAHSMGCCFVALALAQGAPVDGALFTGPMFGLTLSGAPAWLGRTLAAGHRALGLAGRYAPRQPPGGFDGNPLTGDERRWDRYRRLLADYPELAVGPPTWGWVDNALQAMARTMRPATAAGISIPTTILVAEDERLVVNAAAEAFADRLPHGRYRRLAGARHEIMMETDAVRTQFWAEFDALLASISPPSG